MANKNGNLSAAKRAKNDEFYTQLTDIEKELRHYRKHFRGATVLCNCDDPFESNFFKFFVLNFNRLGLKKLIATCYEGSAVAEYRNGKAKPYKAVVTTVHDTTGDGGIDMEDVCNLFELGENELTELEGDGDFRSEECLALLDEADIVVTNPPFSLFREYVAVLMAHQKKFIIVGNKNAITYKEIFPFSGQEVCGARGRVSEIRQLRRYRGVEGCGYSVRLRRRYGSTDYVLYRLSPSFGPLA